MLLEVASLFQDPVRPARTLSNSSFGFRANTLVAVGISRVLLPQLRLAPTFYPEPPTSTGQPFVFQPRYDRIWQAGGTVSKDFGDVVLRGEAVYANGQGYTVADFATAAQGVVKRSTLDYIVSLDISLPFMPADTRLNVQGFQRVYFDGGGGDLAIKDDGFGASVLLSTKLTTPSSRRSCGFRTSRTPAASCGRASPGPSQEHDGGFRRRHLHRLERWLLRSLQQPGPALHGNPLRLLMTALERQSPTPRKQSR